MSQKREIQHGARESLISDIHLSHTINLPVETAQFILVCAEILTHLFAKAECSQVCLGRVNHGELEQARWNDKEKNQFWSSSRREGGVSVTDYPAHFRNFTSSNKLQRSQFGMRAAVSSSFFEINIWNAFLFWRFFMLSNSEGER